MDQYKEVGKMKEVKSKKFANGVVYALTTEDNYPLEVTDTFLPFYTKEASFTHSNSLQKYQTGTRDERWMIGVSCMSGCPVRCGFCATGQLKKWRSLTAQEIVAQVEFIINKNKGRDPNSSMEFKINYTRMGEPFLNIENVKEAIKTISERYPNTHHYISTIGVKGSDFSFIKGNITLQLSIHSLDEERRDSLIPFKAKLSLKELGEIRTNSNLKTSLNYTLVDERDFDIKELKRLFSKDNFFVKLSPINPNKGNDLGEGIIKGVNLL